MKRRAPLGWCLVLPLLTALTSCRTNDYAGTYVGRHPFGADTLVLRPDFTYSHSFRTREGKYYAHRGHWSDWSLQEFDRIDIKNFDWHIPGFEPEFSQDTINSSWPAKLERSLLGNNYISIDEDLDYYYLKIN